MAKFNKPKDKFADLGEEFKDTINSLGENEIRQRIAKISLNHAALMEAKENDEDLKTKKMVAREAGAVYREGAKAQKLSIEFCRARLKELGKDDGDSGVD